MSFVYRSAELRDYDLRSVLMASTSFGLVLFVAIFITCCICCMAILNHSPSGDRRKVLQQAGSCLMQPLFVTIFGLAG